MFSKPCLSELETAYLAQALAQGHLQGDGTFTRRATALLCELTGAPSVLLTTSCSHALELAALLVDLGPGDEVICPSFTFPSAANAIVLRGATPVFVDVDPATLNLDIAKAEAAISDRTKAVSVVHYGGIAAQIDLLQALCSAHDLALIEDNAHGLGAYFKGQHLGTFGDLATQSFHATKNYTMGEGGALLVNNVEKYASRAEILREKGTNRAQFFRGEVDKYTWVDQGSSYLPSDLLAAMLTAQLERFDDILQRRQYIWQRYQIETADWAHDQGVVQMMVPEDCEHPAHLFFLIMPSVEDQTGLIDHLRARGIVATFHFQPLDSSPAGQKYGRTPEPCTVAHDRAAQLVRLPLYADLIDSDIDRVVAGVTSYRVRSQR